jgi:hypothetical protein
MMQVPPPFATGALTTIIRQASLAPGAAIEANTRSVRKSKILNTERAWFYHPG